jgi:hypothetical protein
MFFFLLNIFLLKNSIYFISLTSHCLIQQSSQYLGGAFIGYLIKTVVPHFYNVPNK